MHQADLLTLLQVIFLEGILSLDNAAVLGALVKPLSPTREVRWPRWLRAAKHLNRFLGPEQSAALKIGLLGAYGGRALMLLLATVVMEQPWLRLIGAFYLLGLAVNYLGALRDKGMEAEAEARRLTDRTGFWVVVATVELVDLAFSLDNVVAIVALSREYWVVLGGVMIGILLMRFAASLFTRLITWEPNMETAAYLLIGAISLELLIDEIWHIHLVPSRVGSITVGPDVQQFVLSLLILGLTVAFARLPWLQPLNIIWRPFLLLAALARACLRWLAQPFRILINYMRQQSREPADSEQ